MRETGLTKGGLIIATVLAGALLLFLFYVLAVFILPVAPWARVKPPYFEVSMGEIYKEVSFSQAQEKAGFKIFRPVYLPPNLPSYRVAIKTKPTRTKEVAFYTPDFPGSKPGPLKGLLIRESPALEPERNIASRSKKIKINSAVALIFPLKPAKGWGFYLKRNGTGIKASWFGAEANPDELEKLARFFFAN